MDIRSLRKRTNESLKIDAMKRKIRNEIESYRDGVEDRQYENKETFKPIITAQKEDKETIDKKQNQLINKLQENQQDLIQSVDLLSDVMSV